MSIRDHIHSSNRRQPAGKGAAPATGKPFVGDAGAALDTAQDKAAAGLGMVLFALASGFVIGLLVWAVFWLSSELTKLLWNDAYQVLAAALAGAGVPSWWLPVAFCTLGGLAIGLWTARFGGAPEPLDKVMAAVKESGGYTLKNPLASVVGFLLPLVFGGSVGPEAGLTGIIAAACTKIGTALKGAGLRVVGLADVTVSAALSAVFATPFAGIVATAQDAMPQDGQGGGQALKPEDYTLRRNAKLVLYTAAALGAVAGVVVFTAVFGKESGMPRFEGITPGINKLWWALPCLAAGYVGALLFHCGEAGFGALSRRLEGRTVLKPVIAGLVIGCLAVPLPYVLFPGESQAFELMQRWEELAPLALLATGLAKCLATPLCLRFGWGGGHFFPCIFAGIAAGYGLAGLLGMEPMFAVAITTATLMGGVQRKPLAALALLLLCFPVESVVWMGIACVLGAALPVPSRR